MNYDEMLNGLKTDLEQYKNLKYKAEARLETLNSQKDLLVEEIRNENINPEDLDKEIESLDKEIKFLFEKAKELLPRE